MKQNKVFENPFEPPDYMGSSKNGTKNLRQHEFEWEETMGDSSAFRPNTITHLFDYQKFKWIYLFIVIIFSLLFARLFYLQIIQGKEWREFAEENRFRAQVILSPRGIIYDRNNKMLVKNVPAFDIYCVGADLPRDATVRDQVFNKVKDELALTGEKEKLLEDNIKKVEKESFQLMGLASNIEREKALRLFAQINILPGIKVKTTPIREYLYADAFSHVLGYVGKLTQEELDKVKDKKYIFSDWIGKDGLEITKESLLKGEHGKEQSEVNSSGDVMKLVARQDPVPGKGLVATLDRDLQLKIKEILDGRIRGMRGAVVALVPNTGEVLASVSYPGFDSNVLVRGQDEKKISKIFQSENKPLVNRVIAGTYPPGSTVKPMVAAAALQEGVITPNTTIEDKGVLLVPHEYNPDIIYKFHGWNRAGLGMMDLYSAIAKSSDIYFYQVGGGYKDFKGLGEERLKKYYKIFGLGAKTNIDLPGEAEGFVPDPEWKKRVKNEDWYTGDTYNISIGQGDILTTPLQVAEFTATIANGGKIIEPRLVNEIIDQNKNTIEKIKPKIIRQDFINAANLELSRIGMRKAVTDGSAKILASLPVEVAGKTGTSEHGEGKTPHAWFTSFAPYNNPEIVITVLVEEAGEGSGVAAPIAQEIYKWYFENRITRTREH